MAHILCYADVTRTWTVDTKCPKIPPYVPVYIHTRRDVLSAFRLRVELQTLFWIEKACLRTIDVFAWILVPTLALPAFDTPTGSFHWSHPLLGAPGPNVRWGVKGTWWMLDVSAIFKNGENVRHWPMPNRHPNDAPRPCCKTIEYNQSMVSLGVLKRL